MRFRSACFLILLTSLSSCSTYYQARFQLYDGFERGKINEVEQWLASNNKGATSNTRFLYYLDRGVTASLLGRYEQSNQFFEQAYIFGEDSRKNFGKQALSFLSNPNVTLYRGEDHEHLLLLYYKALNYLKLGDYEKALVECRRMNIRLLQLSDRYKSENRYQKDGFVNTLIGLIYDASGDYNNAFIAYRNAYNVYEDGYFGIEAPRQLKLDLMRTAYLTGFQEELEYYESQFDINFTYEPSQNGDLIFLWNNGLGPVKKEWSINFAVQKGRGGNLFFVNEENGWNFPFLYNAPKEDDAPSVTDLRFFRVALPKYIERKPLYKRAELISGDDLYSLEMAMDINAIAFKTLKQRLGEELSKALLRVAIKKAAEKAAREKSEGLGFAVGLLNAATERADLRNWQTLPHSITYTRIPLKEGEQTYALNLFSERNPAEDQTIEFTFESSKNKTQFFPFFSLESMRYAY